MDELAKLEQAIKAQEALRGILSDEQIEATLAALREKQAALLKGWAGIAAGLIQGHNVVSGVQINIGTPDAAHSADADSLRRAYLSHMLQDLGKVSLAGIDPQAASEAEARLNLGAVYTALLTLTPEECDVLARENCPPERMARTQSRLSVLAHLDREARLVLLGDPGSGKSTFVNFVALCLAGEALGRSDANLEQLRAPLPQEEGDDEKPAPQPWQHGALLPVRVVLRDFAARGLPPAGQPADADTLWAFIAAELGEALAEFAPHLKRHLHERGGLLLFDGLDEVPEAEQRRGQIKQAVEDFAAAFPRCRILVTSRTYAYQQQAWRLAGFAEAVLAPFSRGQIARFVERWYAHIAELRGLDSADAEGRAELLKRAIANSDRLQGLAARPLLLTLMASLHAWRGGSLPEKREQLYADTVDLLLDWWEQPKVVRDKERVVVQQPSLAEWLRVGKDKVQAVLQQLAYAAHAAQPAAVGTADVPETGLIEGLLALNPNDPDVKYKRLVEFLRDRAGLLVPRGVGVYTFPHRTFQEYLAALHLVAYDYPAEVARLAREDPNRWREVALLAGAATTARGSDFALWALVEELCGHNLQAGTVQAEADAWGALLAGQLIVENTNPAQASARDRPKVARVVGHLVRVLEAGKLPAVERAAAGVALAHLGDPRPGVGVRVDGVPDIAWCDVPAGTFVMGSVDDRLSVWGKETPQRRVTVPAFRISRYPITNAQFAAFVAAGGYSQRRFWQEAENASVWQSGRVKGWLDEEWRITPYDFGAPFHLSNHPVVGVMWYEAVAFCHWLSERIGYTIRLPSETEWEKAARGFAPNNAEGLDGRTYPWGDEPDPDKANYSDTGIGTTSAVGAFPAGASPYEVLDLSGNVWEWCGTGWQESYEDYQADLGVSSAAVLRGGAFYDLTRYVRCAVRYGNNPHDRNDLVGFRVACGVPH